MMTSTTYNANPFSEAMTSSSTRTLLKNDDAVHTVPLTTATTNTSSKSPAEDVHALNDDTTATDNSSPEDKNKEVSHVDDREQLKNKKDNEVHKNAGKNNDKIDDPRKDGKITSENLSVKTVVNQSLESCTPLPKNNLIILTGEQHVSPSKPDSKCSTKSKDNNVGKMECMHKKSHDEFVTDGLKVEYDTKWIDKRQLLFNSKCSKCEKYLVKNLSKAADANNCTLFTTMCPMHCCETHLTNGPCKFVLCCTCHSKLILDESGKSNRRRTRIRNKKT